MTSKCKENILKNLAQEHVIFFRCIILCIGIISGCALLLMARLYYLQIHSYKQYMTLSNKNQFSFIPIPPKRGLIFDRHGITLAKNVPAFSLDITRDHAPHLEKTLDLLRTLVPLSQEDVEEFYKSLKRHHRFEPVTLKYKLTDKEVASIYENRYRLPGVTITARLLREYPLKNTLAHVLGYVGRINANDLKNIEKSNYSAAFHIGKSGIEKSYETRLHGHVGYRQIEIDASGRKVRTLKYSPPQNGEDLHLTLDSKLQQAAEKSLGEESGAVVALNPQNGEILTLVSTPSFDPNVFVTGLSHTALHQLQNRLTRPLYNRTIQGLYPLGSTIKPFLALEALDKEVVTPLDYIVDKGQFTYANHVYHDAVVYGHGYVNLLKALIVSCDIFFYQLALKLGMKRISNILKQFGFGQKTNIDIPGEQAGLIPSPQWKWTHLHQGWYTGDTILSGIGQGYLLTTPLQLAYAAATLAHRGESFPPHLILNTPFPSHTSVVLKPTAWDLIIKGMEGVIFDPKGTGVVRFGHPPYPVAAKTGTVQPYQPKYYRHMPDHLRPKKYRNHSIIIAFAPLDHPTIALAIVVEHSPIASNIARKVMDYYFQHQGSVDEH